MKEESRRKWFVCFSPQNFGIFFSPKKKKKFFLSISHWNSKKNRSKTITKKTKFNLQKTFMFNQCWSFKQLRFSWFHLRSQRTKNLGIASVARQTFRNLFQFQWYRIEIIRFWSITFIIFFFDDIIFSIIIVIVWKQTFAIIKFNPIERFIRVDGGEWFAFVSANRIVSRP